MWYLLVTPSNGQFTWVNTPYYSHSVRFFIFNSICDEGIAESFRPGKFLFCKNKNYNYFWPFSFPNSIVLLISSHDDSICTLTIQTDEGKAIQRLPYLGNTSHMQPPNPDTIADSKKCLMTGASYSCLLRGSARAWQIQMWFSQPTIGLSMGSWIEELVKGLKEVKGFCIPIERTRISTNQTPRAPRDQKNQGVHMEGLMVLAEDGFVKHPWQKRPFVLWRLDVSV
jgi:hypothetical protein